MQTILSKSNKYPWTTAERIPMSCNETKHLAIGINQAAATELPIEGEKK